MFYGQIRSLPSRSMAAKFSFFIIRDVPLFPTVKAPQTETQCIVQIKVKDLWLKSGGGGWDCLPQRGPVYPELPLRNPTAREKRL